MISRLLFVRHIAYEGFAKEGACITIWTILAVFTPRLLDLYLAYDWQKSAHVVAISSEVFLFKKWWKQ